MYLLIYSWNSSSDEMQGLGQEWEKLWGKNNVIPKCIWEISTAVCRGNSANPMYIIFLAKSF
jgi:hypothetical protein